MTGSRRLPTAIALGVTLAVLGLVVVAAGAPRPPLTGDGVWTGPLGLALVLAALSLVAAAVLLLLGGPSGGRPEGGRGAGRVRSLLVVAALAVVAGVLPRVAGDAPTTLGGGLFEASDVAPGPVEPVATTPTSVVAGIAAVVLAIAGASVLLVGPRRGGVGSRDRTGPELREVPPTRPPEPHGFPSEVVLQAYAAARHDVVGALGAGEHDPPGRLVVRAAVTPAAPHLATLTRLHLPVRYGRSQASPSDAEAARAALTALRQALGASDRPAAG